MLNVGGAKNLLFESPFHGAAKNLCSMALQDVVMCPGKCATEKGRLIELSENQSCGAKPLCCRKRGNLFGSQGPRWRDRARPQSGNQSGDQPEDCKYDHR